MSSDSVMKPLLPSLVLLTLCLGERAGASNLGVSPFSPAFDKTVDREGRAYLSETCHVGLSIVARSGAQVRFYDYGSIVRGDTIKPTPDSVYELASVTKTFTGALAAKALVEHKMTLDEDFRAYLPGDYPNLVRNGKPITLRTLATHTSGLQRDLPDSEGLMGKPDYDHIGYELAALDQGFTKSKTLAALHGVTLRSAPGTTFLYSNLGIRVISYGLEHQYHSGFADLLQRAILRPLGMHDTGFDPTAAMMARLVTPYSRYGHVQPYHDASAGAAYGLYSTPRDMSRYLGWQLNEHDPVVARAHMLIRGTPDDGQALIWNVAKSDAQRLLWHGGGSFGMTSQMVLYPDTLDGYVLLANDACAGSEGELKGIGMKLHGALHPNP